MTAFESASRDWAREVDAESARLIERGVPPYDAIEQARRIVSRRRARAACEGVPVPGDGAR